MKGSPYGRWLIGHRFQAQLVVPGLFSLVLIILYFFGSTNLQSWVAPGFYDLPLGLGKVSIPGVIKAYCLLWVLILAVRTIIVTSDTEVRFVSIVVGLCTVLTFLSWADGNVLVMRLWSGIAIPESQDGMIWNFLSGGWFTVEFVVISVLSIVFCVMVPIVYGNSRKPVTLLVTPSIWMMATTMLMFAVFKIARVLLGQGWAMTMEVEGPLGTNMSMFMVVIFQYMVLLYMAELNYLSVVRKESPDRTWRLRH